MKITLLALILCLQACSGTIFQKSNRNSERSIENREETRIKPWTEDPRYWQYKGKPLVLIGGSDQDNLFNHPLIGDYGLEAHLDLLVSSGGNYVRNSMSSRDRYDSTSTFFNNDNIYPFYLDEQTGLYDLSRFNDEYWDRLTFFLDLTAEREIIVQMEIWDRWDYSGDRQPHYMGLGWSANPFNPKNNINYSAEETNLDDEEWQGHNIFKTIPELDNVPGVLKFQEYYVEKLISVTLSYDHIIYCISNESNATEEWSLYWAKFILALADETGKGIEVTEMWNNWDLSHHTHRRTFDNPHIYSYVDISQNNHQRGDTHWLNMLSAINRLSDNPRPVNNVKIYGGEHHGGGLAEGSNKFWRNILGGSASARFHRAGRVPGYYGAGLSDVAQNQLRSASMFLKKFDIFIATPDQESRLLKNRQENEAYLTYIEDRQYAIYFPDGGSVYLDVNNESESFTFIQWLDISEQTWVDQEIKDYRETISVTTPKNQGQWIALISAREN